MRKQVALTVALALAAAPQGDAFFQPNAGLVRGPALRGGAVGVCPTASRSARNRTPPLHMSDLSDMAIEILKRAEKQLDTLDDISLARLQGVCQQVADKAARVRGPGAAGPPKKVDYGAKTFDEIEAENDAYFGLGQDDDELEDVAPPPRKAYAPPTSKPAPAPARSVQPASATYTPAARAPAAAAPQPNWPSPAPTRVQNSANQPPPVVAVEGGRQFSKYLPPQAVKEVKKKATVESFVDEDEWMAAYIKEFGAPPPTEPLVDDETPRPAGGSEDAFAEVRQIQASASQYPTPDDYYDALNAAISRWRTKRQDNGGLVGSIVSDRYIDQLASMKPFDSEGKKFSLGCMLVERRGTDDEGNERGLLVTTQVDPPGTLGIAGVQKGDAVLAINGQDIENYADLKEAMNKIHSVGKMTVQVVIQRQAVGVPELLTVTS